MSLPLVSFDLESALIGPGAVAPWIVCATEHKGGKPRLISNGDAEWQGWLRWLVGGAARGEHRLTGQNIAGFDLPTVHHWHPDLRPDIWKAFSDGRVHDIKSREKLLNLMRTGEVDHWYDVTGKQHDFEYNLAALALKWLGKDRTAEKGLTKRELRAQGLTIEQQDLWRYHFSKLDGLPSHKYPEEAARYALEDAVDPLSIHLLQDQSNEELRARGARFPSGKPFDVFQTEALHTGAQFALQLMTIRGFGVDAAEVEKLKRQVAEEVKPERTAKLVLSGILTPAVPSQPFANGAKHGADGKLCDCAAPSHAPGTPKWKAADKAHVKTGLLQEHVVRVIERVNREAEARGEPERLRVKRTDPSDTYPTQATFDHWVELARTDPDPALAKKIKNVRSHNKQGLHPLGGQVSTDGEVIADLAGFDKVIDELDRYSSFKKLWEIEIPRLEWALREGGTIHSVFDELKRTGRTSARKTSDYPSTNVQQLPRGFDVKRPCPGVGGSWRWDGVTWVMVSTVACTAQKDCKCAGKREVVIDRIEPRRCYVAPIKGWVLYSVDYSTLELVTAAQQVYKLVGYSILRDKINAGFDVHSWLAAQIAKSVDADFLALCQHRLGEKVVDKDEVYRLFLKLNKGSEAQKGFFKKFRNLAKATGLGFPGGLGCLTFIKYAKGNYGVQIESIEQAQMLKEIWFEAFPEFKEYFKRINRDFVDGEHEAGEGAPGKSKKRYCYFTPLGMYRANCTYTACANGYALQSPAGEGAKIAVFNVSRASYDSTLRSVLLGTFPMAFVHDELIGCIPEDSVEAMDARVREVQRIMESSMRIVTPDMVVKAEPTLMRRWEKGAELLLDKDGRVRIYEEHGYDPSHPKKDDEGKVLCAYCSRKGADKLHRKAA